MRLFILIIAALEAIFLVMALFLMVKSSTNVELARGKIKKQILILALALIFLILPAMFLAYFFTHLWLALILSVLALILIIRAFWRG